MLDLTRLRLFRELIRRGTMLAVAEAMHLSSSAVSQQLAILERHVGVKLLERVGRRVRPTPEGERFAAHADTVLRAVESADLDLRATRARPEGTLTIASFPSAAKALVLPALARLRVHAPRLRFALQELETPDALQAVREGHCHLAMAFHYGLVPREFDSRLLAREISRDVIGVALPAAARRERAPFALSAVAQADWIVGSRQTDDRLLAERACAIAGFAPRIMHAVDDYDLMLRMVAQGMGVGFVPRMAFDLARIAGVRLLTPRQAGLTRHVHAVTRPALANSPALRALLEELMRARNARRIRRLTPP